MEKDAIKKTLKESMGYKNLYCEKYQDKYYLYKEIHELLPELSENAIYEAIDEVNKTTKSPISGRKFVEAFVEKLEI
jgi:hypothetical protein